MKTNLALFLLTVMALQSNAQNGNESENGLSTKEQSIIKIASHTAQGNLDNLDVALNEGLDNELTVNEIKEILVHIYAYAGFPRSIRGLRTLLEVLEDRKAQRIKDNWGNEASPIVDPRSKYDRGIETLQELTKTNMDGPKPAYQEFSPEMDTFLKEHLFADIFERDVLTYKQRELVTISVIASLGTLEPMLRSHFRLCLNVGWKAGQLEEFTEVIETVCGKEKSKSALIVLEEILKNGKK